MQGTVRGVSGGVVWTFLTGETEDLGGGEVLAITLSEGQEGPILPGAALSARLEMTLSDEGGRWAEDGALRRGRALEGCTVRPYAVLDGQRRPLGAFIVERAARSDGRLAVTAVDSLGSELSGAFADGLRYPATLGEVFSHWLSQTRYAGSAALPNASAVVPEAPDWRGATLRQAGAWIAQAAGAFLQTGADGELMVRPCHSTDAAAALEADELFSLRDGGRAFGPVTRLDFEDDAGETWSVGEGEALGIAGNPLLTPRSQALCEGLLDAVRGLTFREADFRHRGRLETRPGDRVALDNGQLTAIVCRRTLRLMDGLTVECACFSPGSDASGVLRAITPEGGVRAERLVGAVDGGRLAVGSVTARAVAAGAIQAAHLEAGAVTAGAIAAGAIRAEHLSAGAVAADSVEAVTAKLGSLTAGDLETDRLVAGLANAVSLSAGRLSAGSASVDQLSAAILRAAAASAKAGEFDFATVAHLVNSALVVRQAEAGTVSVENLLVTSANLLSATVANLALAAPDGRVYRLFVSTDGRVSAREIEVTPAEREAGETSGGLPIAATSANVGELHAAELSAASAVLEEVLADALTAGRITASEAMIASAAVPALHTTAIRALGDGLDLSANRSVADMVGAAEASLRIAGGEIASRVEETAGDVSALSTRLHQTAEDLAAAISRKADAADVEAWARYSVSGGEGTLELGQKGSRYTTETSPTGFRVKQDGQDMTTMVRGRVASPVFEVKRQIEIGNYSVRADAEGGVLWI